MNSTFVQTSWPVTTPPAQSQTSWPVTTPPAQSQTSWPVTTPPAQSQTSWPVTTPPAQSQTSFQDEPKYEVILNDNGAIVVIFRDWLTQRLHLIPGYETYRYTLDGIYASMTECYCPQCNGKTQLDYTRPIITMQGYKGPTPRDQYACGDANVTDHKYTGTAVHMNSWSNTNIPTVDGIRCIRDLISQDPVLMSVSNNCVPNSCLVNYYRNGSDYVGFHADKELKDPMQTVYTVTLGHPRPFQLKKKKDKNNPAGPLISVTPNAGDLVIMTGNTQKLYKHSIPKRANAKGRVSLTYRVL